MNKANYQLGWQLATFCLLGVALFLILMLAEGRVFMLLTAISFAGVGYGLMQIQTELQKVKHASAKDFGEASYCVFGAAGAFLLAGIFSFITSQVMVLVAGILLLAAAAAVYMYKDKFVAACAKIGIEKSPYMDLGTYILVGSIGLMGLSLFFVGIAKSRGLFEAADVFGTIGAIVGLVGGGLVFLSAFQAMQKALKK